MPSVFSHDSMKRKEKPSVSISWIHPSNYGLLPEKGLPHPQRSWWLYLFATGLNVIFHIYSPKMMSNNTVGFLCDAICCSGTINYVLYTPRAHRSTSAEITWAGATGKLYVCVHIYYRPAMRDRWRHSCRRQFLRVVLFWSPTEGHTLIAIPWIPDMSVFCTVTENGS